MPSLSMVVPTPCWVGRGRDGVVEQRVQLGHGMCRHVGHVIQSGHGVLVVVSPIQHSTSDTSDESHPDILTAYYSSIIPWFGLIADISTTVFETRRSIATQSCYTS